MEKTNIVLLGFMGTGKTSAGLELAKVLNKKFVDADQLLQERTGLAIPEIFRRFGEEGFREREKKIIKELAKQKDLIIATGGGVVLNWENITSLAKTGVLILLTAKPETILKRLQGDGSRPLLGTRPTLERISTLLKARESLYLKAAELIFETDELSPKQVAEGLIDLLNSSKD